MTGKTRTLVVAGHGMAGHRLVEELRTLDTAGSWRVVVLAEEPHAAYDRVALSSYLDGRSAADLSLPAPGLTSDPRVSLRLATAAASIDRAARTVTTTAGDTIGYDALVLATGSKPFVPPVPGRDLPGCFTYRTLADLDAIREAAAPGRPGVVVGGGLLGLEAANALRLLGMEPHVVELAPRLMPVQVDAAGGGVLGRRVAQRGLHAHCGVATASVQAGPDGRAAGVSLADGTVLEASVVVFSAGVRPRDELAAPADLDRGERGGFLVDALCRTQDSRIWAIGECAAVSGRCHGLAAPGYRMAESVARQLLGLGGEAFGEPDMSTRLKLLGVEVASFGDAHAGTAGSLELSRLDETRGTYAKVVLGADCRTLLGGILVGDARAYADLLPYVGRPAPSAAHRLLAPAS
ncbi:NAD(P)/FAD-dependent oxidoreductase [Streptomyces globosus]|uniref:NAD(P)/FAD-dependent oxidoreductase n=1 Tax=Streptomyces globosus TaxID=68209 RepID=A0A344TU02_9ACTN|nr:FAD-dependent oxidoreductase [Streptomyces globosus]AXE22123.1 NAD(P)/FAD-dependent oxidoreductase [Streptomyces globosus]